MVAGLDPRRQDGSHVATIKAYDDHMEVGIRELKRRLSEYVEQAARGEMIQVTDRGKPKAVLGPLPGRGNLERGIAEGWISPGNGEPADVGGPRFRPRQPTADVLTEDRGD